jgi:hypothetical protein
MGKFLESIGIWEHKLGNYTFRFEPDILNFDEVSKMTSEYSKNKDMAYLLKRMCEYYVSLVFKVGKYTDENGAEFTITEEDKKDLPLFIKSHQMKVMDDILISHRLASEEDKKKAEKLKEDMIKNSIGAAQ